MLVFVFQGNGQIHLQISDGLDGASYLFSPSFASMVIQKYLPKLICDTSSWSAMSRRIGACMVRHNIHILGGIHWLYWVPSNLRPTC